MPAKDLTQWKQNEDGTWSRLHGKPVIEADEAEVAEVEEEAEAAADENGYWEMTKVELEEELSSRGLPKYGNKDELIARLEENDTA